MRRVRNALDSSFMASLVSSGDKRFKTISDRIDDAESLCFCARLWRKQNISFFQYLILYIHSNGRPILYWHALCSDQTRYKNQKGDKFMKKIILTILLAISIGTVHAATIEVSRPKKMTSHDHYERNPSALIDSTGKYWLFYLRADTLTHREGSDVIW